MPKTRLSKRTQKDIKAVLLIAVAGSLIGGPFSYFTADSGLPALFQGMLDGFFIALALGIYGFFVARRLLTKLFSELSFSTVVLIDTLAYLVIFLGARFFAQLLTVRDAVAVARGFFPANFFPALGLAFVVLFIVNFLLQTNRLVGQNVLKNFALGTYHRPKDEERIFMFLDLDSSTAIAETLGDKKFHTFLRRYYNDLTNAVLETGGEIYKYVGDEVIITWKIGKGVEDANCVRCFFRITEDIQANRERYLADFGVAPSFRAGMHCGHVVAGEIGDVKQEIAFLGDVLNTTARLEEISKERQRRLIISDDLLREIEVPADCAVEDLGLVQPSGKQQPFKIHAVEKTA